MTSERDLIGTVIGGYRATRALGTGTMGDVYEGEHVETGALVALKILHPHHNGSEAAARFLREGKTLALFKHENIVELLEVGQGSDGTMFLATELVRGVSLGALVAEGPVEPHRALAIVEQILAALGTAHAVGVVHRDVKPDNVMLVDGGSAGGTDLVKVLDFGVAKLLGDTPQLLGEANLTQAGLSVFGSPDYMAPEVALGKPVDARTDLYSVGAVLFELLTGKPPFAAAAPTEILLLAITTPAPTLAAHAPERSFTPQLEHVVAEALAKEPAQRFQSAEAMIAAVKAARHSLDLPSMSTILRAGAVTLPAAPVVAAAAPDPALVGRGDRLVAAGAWVRAHKLVLAAGAAAVLAVVVVASLLGGSKGSRARSGEASSFVSLGHERFAAGRRLDALAAYERALVLSPSLGANTDLRGKLAQILDGKDAVASVIALELLASRMQPPARDAVAAAASTAKLPEVRHRAFALAERDGFDGMVDRVDSYSLDLQQAATCDDRKAAIDKLADSGDARAVPALKKVRTVKCVEQAAADAIARLEH
jgi:hypothetical protein